jgi:L-asparaginase II
MNDFTAVEVIRGEILESSHTGILCIVDASGMVISSFGDISRPVFPHGSINLIKAIPFLEKDVLKSFQFNEKHLAYFMGEGSTSLKQVDLARDILAKLELSEEDLECEAVQMNGHSSRLYARQAPHHLALLTLCRHNRYAVKNYNDYNHGVQADMRKILQDMIGVTLQKNVLGYDATHNPTYAVPLKTLAYTFAKLSTGSGLTKERRSIVKELFSTVQHNLDYMGQDGLFDHDIIKALKSRIYLKTGAEGVIMASLPHLGLGLALKATDGSQRAAHCMMAYVIETLLMLSGTDRKALQNHLYPALTSPDGQKLAEIVPSEQFIRALAPLRLTYAA